jgi:hypothetical protein
MKRPSEHCATAYAIGGLTLALLVIFITLDVQAMQRESTRSYLVSENVYAPGLPASRLIARD